jgi:hypothetical protein
LEEGKAKEATGVESQPQAIYIHCAGKDRFEEKKQTSAE